MSFLSQPITIYSLLNPNRKIGTIEVNVVLDEATTDTLVVTKQPVQQGSSITDHSFKEPTVLSMRALFRDNLSPSLAKIYTQLLDLQNTRQPFDVTTPKRVYKNMLISALTCTTDRTTENVLAIAFTFQQVIIVQIQTTTAPRAKQKQPKATEATQNGGKKSAIVSLKEGLGALIGK